ncbi:iron uptake transporter deferrochelatase/peroxidase subunit [Streptomyces sp. NBC_01089]|uniref:iron uptake transporter deferrochelatase/peroxidase subunit n=1 Tax=Streptomyces sp. NBC_01089 TaxID=2903747 RepID=UPI00386EE208|nr:iron uptake transporter deferrochelatase/peroxidase subunit [Streptomyces sp. NBC_01089]
MNDISRRRLLGTAGAVGAGGLVAGAAGGAGVRAATEAAPPTALTTVGSTEVAFHSTEKTAGSGKSAGSGKTAGSSGSAGSAHSAPQSGITTPAQSTGYLIAFDLAAGAGRTQAAALLRRWSASTQRMMAGEPVSSGDTGIALDAGPSSLTVTFGFGRSFFSRTGLTAQRPTQLDPLPDFASDQLDAGRSNGDLWVQIGANDPLVAFHALRALQNEAGTAARVRWQMNGFNRAPGATAKPMTVRNLMGQVDGTGNPKPSDSDFDRRIFVPAGGGTGAEAQPEWMAGGSYAVVRRIRMLLDDWEKLPLKKQEQVIGRRKKDGAPLTGGTETTAMDLDKVGPDGKFVIPDNAHARISAPEQNGGAALLRRTFSYHDGIGRDGTPDAGLLFVCWQADPDHGFVPVQRKLDRGDALSTFIRHEASGLFAVPAAAGPGEYVGQRLVEGH